MTDTSGAPDVVVGRRTQGMQNDPTAPPGAESGMVVMRSTNTGALSVVPRYGFENSWRYRGWEEVDVTTEREDLLAEAKEMGVNVSDNADGRTIVEAIRAFKKSNRTVTS